MKFYYTKEAKKIYNRVKKRVEENPHKCEICGTVETMDNLMLKYDNGKVMCDECMIKFYEGEENNEL